MKLASSFIPQPIIQCDPGNHFSGYSAYYIELFILTIEFLDSWWFLSENQFLLKNFIAILISLSQGKDFCQFFRKQEILSLL